MGGAGEGRSREGGRDSGEWGGTKGEWHGGEM